MAASSLIMDQGLGRLLQDGLPRNLIRRVVEATLERLSAEPDEDFLCQAFPGLRGGARLFGGYAGRSPGPHAASAAPAASDASTAASLSELWGRGQSSATLERTTEVLSRALAQELEGTHGLVQA